MVFKWIVVYCNQDSNEFNQVKHSYFFMMNTLNVASGSVLNWFCVPRDFRKVKVPDFIIKCHNMGLHLDSMHLISMCVYSN